MKHLVFQVHGSMVAWGKPGGDEQRPSYRSPSKSAMLGLIAASEGTRRSDANRQQTLSKNLRYAVAVEASGQELSDYHTTLPPQKDRDFIQTRKEEIDWGTGNAIITRRDYRVDSLSTVIFWRKENGENLSLSELHNALKHPHYAPYLGRKSCPPSIPFFPNIVDSASLLEAIERYWEYRPNGGVPRLHADDSQELELLWEPGHPDPGLKAAEVILSRREQQRRDQPADRTNWTFRQRWEKKAIIRRS